ncbi:MAG: hypothetical protein HY005_00480 [Candidatus Staskawiczbacteria bacterium]|nr:hypothetical protein [Candidatus Staskawiczbacteria bacterium]MBI3337087.1 hypothetical protein [Candidatus Staskawiczbacteria bacterium]
MINLLPPKEKEKLSLERNKKLTIILGYIIIIPLVYLALVLFSLKFYILGQMSYQKSVLGSVEAKYETSDFLSYGSIVKKYNEGLIKADTFYKKEVYFSNVIKTILDIQRPDGLFFNDVSINVDEKDNKIKVNISGQSDTRDNLLIFKDNIESNNKIKDVYFPPNSWIKSADINFYVTFEFLYDEK